MKTVYSTIATILSLAILTSCGSESSSSASPTAVTEYNTDPYNGVMTTFFQDGKTVQQSFEMKDSLKHGAAVQYYETGEVNTKMTFVEDLREDTAYVYSKSGKLIRTTPYMADDKHGMSYGYYNNGDLEYEMPYEYGKPVPGLVQYSEDGTIKPEPKIEFDKNKDGTYTARIEPKRTKVQYYKVRSNQAGPEVIYTAQGNIPSKRGKCTVDNTRMICAKVFNSNKTCYLIFGRP